MKFVPFYILLITFWVNGKYSVAQQIINSDAKSIFIDDTPNLIIESLSLRDQNNDNAVDPEEECFLEIVLSNKGEGVAKSIYLDASQENTDVRGFRFSDSTNVGDMIEGEIDTLIMKLYALISIGDGIVDMNIKAIELNGSHSEAKHIRFKLNSKNQSFAVGWINPFEDTTIVSVSKAEINCCLVSSAPIKDITIHLNDDMFADGLDADVIESDDCDYEFIRQLQLREGHNTVSVEIGNGHEIIWSEERTIIFEPLSMDHRLALVIGNGAYSTNPLRNPTNDARDMANALRALEFDVIELINGDEEQMKDSLRLFREQLEEKKGVGLFYYAGHGVQVGGDNFLIPIKNDISHAEDVAVQSLPLDTVLNYMQNSGSRTNIVILDACRDNPYQQKTRSVARGLAEINYSGSGFFIAYATSPGSTADDGEDENGLYTQELLKVINRHDLAIESIFREVRVNVSRETLGVQVPWTSSSIVEEFYFQIRSHSVKTVDE